jgi:hypothetical protein
LEERERESINCPYERLLIRIYILVFKYKYFTYTTFSANIDSRYCGFDFRQLSIAHNYAKKDKPSCVALLDISVH